MGSERTASIAMVLAAVMAASSVVRMFAGWDDANPRHDSVFIIGLAIAFAAVAIAWSSAARDAVKQANRAADAEVE